MVHYKCLHCGRGFASKASVMRHGRGMHGGSWNDFTSWVKGAANTVGNAVTGAAKAVYNGAKMVATTVGPMALDALKKVKPSDLLSLIPHPAGATAAMVAKQIGLGRRKRKGGERVATGGRGVTGGVLAFPHNGAGKRKRGGERVATGGRGRKGGRKMGANAREVYHDNGGTNLIDKGLPTSGRGGLKGPGSDWYSHAGAIENRERPGIIIRQHHTAQGFLTAPMSLNGGVGANGIGFRV
jgi:hypothetical protein